LSADLTSRSRRAAGGKAPGEARKPRADAQRNRDGLLEASKAAFAEVGPEASLDEIARRAGVGIGTLYRHFPTRDAIVEAVFENDAHDLRPGMFVTARLSVGEQSLPAVPAGAVRADGTLRHVYVAVGGRLEDRLVQAGEAQGGEIPIVTGLKAGEEVVAELTPDVRDGVRVK